ncbi:MAG: hypothetical protein IKQ39_00325 [Oscillospiraceae bacterium]|nr:hypothetical protein [Oscillospiraceae bacterium]
MDDFHSALAAAVRDAGGKGVGTLGEKTLHLALKYYFAPDPGTHERPVGGFIADAVTEEGIIEIQTRGLSRLRRKLAAFLPVCPVTVVFPVAEEKWLMRVDEAGELRSKRRSPKHESLYTAVREIYTLRDYLTNPRLTVCLCRLSIAEYILGSDRRSRRRLDRVPLALQGITELRTPADYAALLPDALPEPFTVKELRGLTGQNEMLGGILVNLLARVGCVMQCGMRGRQKLWTRTECVSDVIRR